MCACFYGVVGVGCGVGIVFVSLVVVVHKIMQPKCGEEAFFYIFSLFPCHTLNLRPYRDESVVSRNQYLIRCTPNIGIVD